MSHASPQNRQILLATRPSGIPTEDNFRMVAGVVPEAREGQVLLRHTHLGLAPAARLRMGEAKSYAAPLAIGDVVYGQAIGVVVQSHDPDFQPGETLMSMHGGWQEYSVARAPALTRVDTAIAPATAWLGNLGSSGMTAYIGLLDIGQVRQGETVVVSAASGAVGSAVGQIAKIRGCRVVGVAGGPEKCAYAIEKLGFDACIDYRGSDVAGALQEACPAGVDVYFENVGGSTRAAVWPLLNQDGRVVLCGLISEYNTAPQEGPGWFPILAKRLTIRGFIMSDHLDRRPAFLHDMVQWVTAGRIRENTHFFHGLDQTVAAFSSMLRGAHLGKTVVQL